MEHSMPIPDFTRLEKRLRLYIVRHGESVGNSQGILQGQKNYPLSELGREQSHSAAQYLADRGIECILTSPLLRAKETAGIIASAAALPAPQEDDRLMELKTGIFTGMTVREIEREYPVEWNAFRQNSWEAVPEAESIDSLWTRAVAVWNQIIETANNGKRHILVVTHGGFIQWLLKTSMGAPPLWMPLMPTANCGIFEYLAYPVPEKSYYGSWLSINQLPY